MQATIERVPDSDEALGVEGGDVVYAALLERHAAAEPVTDEMVHRAGLRGAPAGERPPAPRATGADAAEASRAETGAMTMDTLARWLGVRR